MVTSSSGWLVAITPSPSMRTLTTAPLAAAISSVVTMTYSINHNNNNSYDAVIARYQV